MDGSVNINVGLDQTLEINCDECESSVFRPAFLLRKVSPLVSPSGKEAVIPIQVFACASCGHINEEFMPIERS